MKIAIAGVGGIGSNVAVNLVRSGISFLRIVDYDKVEYSNLNRQFYFHDQIGRFKVEALAENLKRILPELVVELVIDRVDANNCRSIFAGCDLIVEGFDRQEDKKMLVEYLGSERLLVSACGIAGSDLAAIRSRRLGASCIVGDFSTDCQGAPLFAHKVTTVAGFMTEFIIQQGVEHGKKND